MRDYTMVVGGYTAYLNQRRLLGGDFPTLLALGPDYRDDTHAYWEFGSWVESADMDELEAFLATIETCPIACAFDDPDTLVAAIQLLYNSNGEATEERYGSPEDIGIEYVPHIDWPGRDASNRGPALAWPKHLFEPTA